MRILITGDFCPRFRVAELIEKGDFAALLSDAKELTGKADYSIVNFECPVVEHEAQSISKQGPNLRCTRKGLEAVKWTGFNCVTLANNHFLDFGNVGVVDTLNASQEIGLDAVGGGKNITEASQTLIKEIAGARLAVINCCEHEFSIATESSAGSNPLDPIAQYYAIKEARKKADRVLVIVHGGHEHFQLPSLRMKEVYRFLIDAGADAVVNHHQHCYSGYEVYNGKPIFYGLGNFCFDHNNNRTSKWVEGYGVIIDFSECVRFEIYPYKQCGDTPGMHLLEQNAFDEHLSDLNSTISDTNKLEKSLRDYYSKCERGVEAVLSPLGGRYYSAAINRGLAPSFVSKKRKLRLENLMCCEAHRDKLHYYLNKRMK